MSAPTSTVPSTTGTTALYGVLGWPVAHSLSPVIQSVAIARQGLDAVYLALPVAPDDLPRAVAGLDAAGVAGLNVTAPHKETILPLLSGVSDLAAGLGAVNTVHRGPGGALFGDNTDVAGLAAAIAEVRPDLGGGLGVVLGAGGAAAAAVISLIRCGAGRVVVLGRTPARAEALVARLEASGLCPGVALEAGRLEARAPVLGEAAAVVQTTSAPPEDGAPIDPGALSPEAVAVEIVYHPADTPFLEGARRAGLATVAGLSMLVHQGALAWACWTGARLGPADVQAMRRAGEEALFARA
jgi:shikimate dehydrogenase